MSQGPEPGEESRGREPEPPRKPWAVGADEALAALAVTRDGLAAAEARRRRERFGPNRLRSLERRGIWSILWDQVKSLIMLLLLAALVVSLAFGQTIEAIAIAAVIVLNTAIGFVTEWRAVRSMESLRKLAEVEASVRRQGREERLPAEELVPGDVVLLQGGDVVAADLRLIDVSELQLDESALTGESAPVSKSVDAVAEDVELAERTNMAYRGTAVTRGSGVGLVVGSGMETELGAISSMVEAAGAEETPLEKKLDRLGRKLVWLTLAVAAGVTGAGVLAGRELYLMLETGIALAVAAVPEGLPIVATVALARGMWRMLKRNALIRRLSSVETLGATTVICTDKTGTLTEGEMRAERIILPSETIELSEGEQPFRASGESRDPEKDEPLCRAIEVGVLCNAAGPVEQGASHDRPAGDPIEIALLELGRRAGLPRAELVERARQVREVPFDRQTKMMATFHESADGYRVAVKGAPEAVLEACTQLLDEEGAAELDDEARRAWHRRSEELAEEGLRVLSMAEKQVADDQADPYEGLCFLGHVAFLDPPRTDVREVIDECQDAGIRVVMVTGDHPATAAKVARAVGIDGADDLEIVRGAELPADGELAGEQRQRALRAAIFARVSPAQKLQLIDLHQADGAIVAMTGDGVNDAPALRSADIGVAMGERGTEVAREAADMVLQDDEFSTIVAAVEQGRVIFSNIRKFVVYLLSGNVGEILAVGAAAAAGLPLPLLPLQILYINLVNDVFPALALGVGKGSGNELQRPPRDPGEAVITRYGWGVIAGYGVVIAATVLGVFVYALYETGMEQTQAVTVSFLTLSGSRLLHVFNMRGPESGFVRNEVTRNSSVWGALGLCLALLLLAVYVPVLADVLGVAAPGPAQWLLVGVGSVIPLLVGQVYLAVRLRRK